MKFYKKIISYGLVPCALGVGYTYHLKNSYPSYIRDRNNLFVVDKKILDTYTYHYRPNIYQYAFNNAAFFENNSDRVEDVAGALIRHKIQVNHNTVSFQNLLSEQLLGCLIYRLYDFIYII